MRTVLCVDDDADDREMVSDAIRKIDPSVNIVHAEDGKVALDYLSNVKSNDELPCLVIMDINMPKMDGKEALAHIKKDSRFNELPVVILSTSGNAIDKLYCNNYGVQFITKPYSFSRLRNEIESVLRHCA
ncbi:MAG TPA: response regulator [Chitinophagaceae bacterium]|nr:response regulator [Chitinophagaceae bacterium]